MTHLATRASAVLIASVAGAGMVLALPAQGWAQDAKAEPPAIRLDAADAVPFGSAREIKLQLPSETGGGFFGGLNELFAPKEVLLDITRLGSSNFKQDALVLAGSAAVAGLAADDVDEFFVATRPERLDDVTDTMSVLGSRVLLYPALASAFFIGKAMDRPGITRTAAQMTQALLLTDILVTPLKIATRRTRPDGSNNRSFPSGHTAGAFALATVLQHNYGLKVGVPAYAFASLMGAARIDGRHHFVSDVIVGAAIGYFAATTVNKRFRGKELHIHMVSGPQGGTGLGCTLEF